MLFISVHFPTYLVDQKMTPETGMAALALIGLFNILGSYAWGGGRRGIAFLFHQIGSFLGVWLGGYLFDATGSYDVMWTMTIATGVVAALINLPIDERQIVRPAPMPA